MEKLDEAGILAILEHIPSQPARAQLSCLNRMWHRTVGSCWKVIGMSAKDEAQFEQFIYWLSKQLPDNPGGLASLLACITGRREAPALRLESRHLTGIARFRQLRRLHMAELEPLDLKSAVTTPILPEITSGTLIPLEELHHLEALTRLVDLAIMCPGCPLQGDASLCRPVCWPKLQLLHLKIDEGVWRVPSRGQECYCLEDTINSCKALASLVVLGGTLEKTVELPALRVAKLACNSDGPLPIGECAILTNLVTSKGHHKPDQFARYPTLQSLSDSSPSRPWAPGCVAHELAHMTNIRHLALSQYQPTAAEIDLREFGALPNLLALKLAFRAPAPVDVFVHSSLSNLRSLHLGDGLLPCINGVGTLERLPNLVHLVIHALQQPPEITLPSLRVLSLVGGVGHALRGPWPLFQEAGRLTTLDFKRVALPRSPQHMRGVLMCQQLRQLSVTVSSARSWQDLAAGNDFDFIAFLLHNLPCLPALHSLCLASINHPATKLPSAPLARLLHLSLGAYTLGFAPPLPPGLPPSLLSFQLVCLEAEPPTAKWLADEAHLPLERARLDRHEVLLAKRGPAHPMDVQPSILDDLVAGPMFGMVAGGQEWGGMPPNFFDVFDEEEWEDWGDGGPLMPPLLDPSDSDDEEEEDDEDGGEDEDFPFHHAAGLAILAAAEALEDEAFNDGDVEAMGHQEIIADHTAADGDGDPSPGLASDIVTDDAASLDQPVGEACQDSGGEQVHEAAVDLALRPDAKAGGSSSRDEVAVGDGRGEPPAKRLCREQE